MDAASKHEVISDLILKNNQVLAEMNELEQWKKEALPKLEKVSKEEIASEVLAKRIVELESDLSRAKRALVGLEEALMVSVYIICSCLASASASIRHISQTHMIILLYMFRPSRWKDKNFHNRSLPRNKRYVPRKRIVPHGVISEMFRNDISRAKSMSRAYD